MTNNDKQNSPNPLFSFLNRTEEGVGEAEETTEEEAVGGAEVAE